MRGKQLRQLRDGLIQELNLDRTATTEAVCVRLCEVMAARMERDIRLRFDPLGEDVSGLWAKSQEGVYVILVTTTRSWTHRLHILLHEIAHMVCGHEPVQLSAEEGNRLFRPDLSPEMLTIMAGRTRSAWSREEEREAERVAGALMEGLLDWAAEQDVEPFQPAENDRMAGVWYMLSYTPGRDAP